MFTECLICANNFYVGYLICYSKQHCQVAVYILCPEYEEANVESTQEGIQLGSKAAEVWT